MRHGKKQKKGDQSIGNIVGNKNCIWRDQDNAQSKEFKVANINMFKEGNLIQIKGSIMAIYHQVENINKEMEIV